MDFPKSVGKMTKSECALKLRQALAESKIESKAELSRLTSIPESTLGGYFNATYLPPQQNWNTIREYLCPGELPIKEDNMSEDEATHRALKVEALSKSINASIFVLKDELEYFKDQPEKLREILKKHLDVEEASYTITLFKALYNQEELDIWKAF